MVHRNEVKMFKTCSEITLIRLWFHLMMSFEHFDVISGPLWSIINRP